MRITRNKMFGRGIQIGKVTAPAARDTDFFAQLRGMIEQNHTPAPLSGNRRAHHAGGTRADNHHVRQDRSQA
jgi:hypothetical protein